MTEKDPAQDKIYERADIAFKKLSAADGDIIVVTFPSNILMEQMQAFASYMESAIPTGVTVFCTKDGVTMDLLPKEQLNALGWYNMNDTTGSETIN